MILNSLVAVRCGSTASNRRDQSSLVNGVLTPAQQSLWARLCTESFRLGRRRGESPPIGVRALAKLLKVGVSETYHHGLRQSKHAALVAADIDEPEHHEVVELFESLP